jgi:hypothetical protein
MEGSGSGSIYDKRTRLRIREAQNLTNPAQGALDCGKITVFQRLLDYFFKRRLGPFKHIKNKWRVTDTAFYNASKVREISLTRIH